MIVDKFNNFFNGKKVLITGHTGFKGSWLVVWLRELGAELAGFALEPATSPSLFEILQLKDQVESYIGDIVDYKKLENVVKRVEPDIVFHMAAQSLVKPSYENPLETYTVNVIGTANLLEACRHTESVKAIINVTSDKCYENDGGKKGYKENDPMGGYDPYSSSKGCAELVSSSFSRSFFNPDEYGGHGKALATVRAGNVIGGGDWASDRLIPDCVRAFLSGNKIKIRYPDAVRPWQHVLEPLNGYLLLAKYLYEEGGEYSGGWNFGSHASDTKSVRWIVERVIELWGDQALWEVDSNRNSYEATHLRLNWEKANTRLGWTPKWNLEFTLEKTIEWYKRFKNGDDMLPYTMEQIKSYST